LNSLRILVVDDNVDCANTLARALRVAGHTVHVAFDGKSAMELARKVLPEIVMLDLGLPDMTGYELCSKIREQAGSNLLLAIAITGWHDEAARQQSLRAGFDQHFVKPVRFEEIERAIDGYC
jgi:DNA-binding response OmpR family regulator